MLIMDISNMNASNTRWIYMNTRINMAPNGVIYLTFKLFEDAGLKHGFSTRIGGVSKGIYKSMNLSFMRGDDYESVLENHRRFAEAVGYDYTQTVFSDQVHGVHIARVGTEDRGHGMHGEKGISEADGLVTDQAGVPLMTFYADCVPLFFYDPVEKVIASSHSGWRGTVAGMGGHTVEYMVSQMGCNREDILAVIGPSICMDCYEVSADVAEQFMAVYPKSVHNSILRSKKDNKYMLNLWKANEHTLLESGLKQEHIALPDICTCHNPELMISHRETGGQRGNLAGVLVL